MPVAHPPLASIRRLLVFEPNQKLLHLGLNRSRQQPRRSVPQQFQRVCHRPRHVWIPQQNDLIFTSWRIRSLTGIDNLENHQEYAAPSLLQPQLSSITPFIA